MIDLKEEDLIAISKFATESAERLSKFANEVDANSLDSGSKTVTREFDQMIRMIRPTTPLVEKGIVRVKEVQPGTDKAIFSVQAQQSYTWTEFDARGSEKPSLAAGSGSYQSYTAPAYAEVTPTTKTATLQIFENIDLVNRAY